MPYDETRNDDLHLAPQDKKGVKQGHMHIIFSELSEGFLIPAMAPGSPGIPVPGGDSMLASGHWDKAQNHPRCKEHPAYPAFKKALDGGKIGIKTERVQPLAMDLKSTEGAYIARIAVLEAEVARLKGGK